MSHPENLSPDYHGIKYQHIYETVLSVQGFKLKENTPQGRFNFFAPLLPYVTHTEVHDPTITLPTPIGILDLDVDPIVELIRFPNPIGYDPNTEFEQRVVILNNLPRDIRLNVIMTYIVWYYIAFRLEGFDYLKRKFFPYVATVSTLLSYKQLDIDKILKAAKDPGSQETMKKISNTNAKYYIDLLVSKYDLMLSQMGYDDFFNSIFVRNNNTSRAMATSGAIFWALPDSSDKQEDHHFIFQTIRFYQTVEDTNTLQEYATFLFSEMKNLFANPNALCIFPFGQIQPKDPSASLETRKAIELFNFWPGATMIIPQHAQISLSFQSIFPSVSMRKKDNKEGTTIAQDLSGQFNLEEGGWSVTYLYTSDIIKHSPVPHVEEASSKPLDVKDLSLEEKEEALKLEKLGVLTDVREVIGSVAKYQKDGKEEIETLFFETQLPLTEYDIVVRLPYIPPKSDVVSRIFYDGKVDDNQDDQQIVLSSS